MPFTTQPTRPPRRLGRGLRILAGLVVLLAGAGFLGHLWWTGGDDVTETEPLPVRPPRANIEDYRIPVAPPEVVPTTLPAARQPPPTPAAQDQPVPRPQRVAVARGERKPIRLGDVAWNVGVINPQGENFQDGRQPLQALGCSLRLGQALIPIVLVDAISSHVGQQVVASVTTDIKSTDIGYEDKTLIPAGTRIVGNTVGVQELTVDQGRLAIVWTQMSAPEGFGGDPRYTQVSIGDASGQSVDGSGGMGGDVDYHWGRIVLYAALVTVFNVAQNEAFNDNEYGEEAAGTLGQFGNRVLDRTLDWRPTISIPAGTQGQVRIQKTTRVC